MQQVFGLDMGYLFGQQGYEYVESGRVWQMARFIGQVLWLVLMLRALWPALRRRDAARPIALLFAGASVAIGLFYAAGFALLVWFVAGVFVQRRVVSATVEAPLVGAGHAAPAAAADIPCHTGQSSALCRAGL